MITSSYYYWLQLSIGRAASDYLLTHPLCPPPLVREGGRILEERLRLSLTLLIVSAPSQKSGKRCLERGKAYF